MRAPVLILGFLFAWVTALAGCGDDNGGGTNKPVGAAKEITAFRFAAANNAGLTADVVATITGSSITATVPFATNLKALVATFETTGASVTVGGTTQVSGTTANDFSAVLAYTVTAEDDSSRNYTVTVTAAPSNANAITAFAFTRANNAALAADVVATINGGDITATVPFATDVTALVATFTTTGASVKVAGAAQTSDVTANDFTKPVTYTVTAGDGSTQRFTVTVTVAANPAKALTAFAFASVNNPGLPVDVSATIDQAAHTIAATVPFGTDVTGLVASFATTGASVQVDGVPQVSGTTSHDFTAPVTYTVLAADATTQAYVVTVTVAPSTSKAITAFAFDTVNNPGLTTNVTATIDEANHTIAASVPFATDVGKLVATFTSTGDKVEVAGVAQASGQTQNDFTSPVAYVVTAADGSTATYVVTVTVLANDAKAITEYAFTVVHNPILTSDAVVTITGTNISAVLPFGTPAAAIKTLVADFTTTGDAITVAGAPQVSGTTSNDFTGPVAYVVTAQDGTTATFTVTVTIAKNPAKDLTRFQFLLAKNPAIKLDSTGVIDATTRTITVEVTAGVAIDALVATFTTTGVTVQVNGADQTSGTTSNDFTAPVTYTVMAEDGTTQSYVVTVKRFVTSFTFTGAKGNEATFAADGSSAGISNQVAMSRKNIAGIATDNVFNGSGWITAATIDPADHYYAFTVSPTTTMTLTQLALRDQRSNTGPKSFSLRSSVDGFAADIGGVLTTHTAIAPTVIALPAAFANLTAPVEFRLYGFSAQATGGTWRIDDVLLSGSVP